MKTFKAEIRIPDGRFTVEDIENAIRDGLMRAVIREWRYINGPQSYPPIANLRQFDHVTITEVT